MEHFYNTIDGWFNFKDIYDLAVRDACDGSVFVEVGSWYGRSAAYLAVEIANSGKQIDFYCADTWQGSVDTPWMAQHLAGKGGTAFPFFRENLERGGVFDKVRTLQMPSTVAAETFAPESLDFVLIDGAHDYSSVRADIRAWLPKVKKGGIIAGDDADWPGVLIGVHDTIPLSEIEILNGGANWMHRKVRKNRGTWTARVEKLDPSDFLAVIPFVNRPDLLDQAVHSVRKLWSSLVVVDQSKDGLNPDQTPWTNSIAGIFRVQPGSQSFTQMMNWALAEATERAASYLVFMHNDAECRNSVEEAAMEAARANPSVGVVFTNYDAYAVFRVSAMMDTGPWDETFQWYFSDNDYYRRLGLANWQVHQLGGENVLHPASQTLCSDPKIRAEVNAHWGWHQDHYRHKWGGSPGSERFTIPYNGKP